MSTQCDHYVDISLECEKCYKILETLEDYLTKNKKSMKQYEDFEEDYEIIKYKSSRRSANSFF